jgi:hypothetical protein
MSEDQSTPVVIGASGHARIESPARADGYRPICDPLWVWSALTGGAPVEETRLVVYAAARRLDAAHLQIERVREGLDRLRNEAPPLGSPAGRGVAHQAITDAEMAIWALDMALKVVVTLTERYQLNTPVPKLVRDAQPFVQRLRDHYSHIDERALGLFRGKPDPRAEKAWGHTAVIDARQYSDGNASLGLDDEITQLCIAARDYLVAAWVEIDQLHKPAMRIH